MIPSRGAQWSRGAGLNAVHIRVSPQSSRLFSIPQSVPQNSSNLLRNRSSVANHYVRSFSSTPRAQWSPFSLWGSSKSQPPPSTSEFVTASSHEFAQFNQDWQPPTSAPSNPQSVDSAPAVTSHLEVTAAPVEHHGTPLQGPETLLPDPVAQHSAIDDITSPLESIPEKVGYLKEVGLEYGFGPSSLMQNLLEYLHIYGGIPWYGSAVITALLIRMAFLRMQVRNSHSTAKLQELKPTTEPLQERLKIAREEGDNAALAKLTKELRAVRQEMDFKLSRVFVPMIGAGVLGFGTWRNLRGMAELPIPALEVESFLWINDFSVSDPTYMLALVQPVLMYWNLKQAAAGQSTQGVAPEMARFQQILRRLIPCITFAIVIFQPAIVQLYFLTTSAVNAATITGLRSRAIRSWLGLAQFPGNTAVPRAVVRADYAGQVRAAGRLVSRSEGSSSAVPVTQNISFVDRGVDNFKSMWGNTDVDRTKNKKLAKAERQTKLEKQRSDDYEQRRLKEIFSETSQKNQALAAAFQYQRTQKRTLEEQRAMEEIAMEDEAERRTQTDGRRVKRGKGKVKDNI